MQDRPLSTIVEEENDRSNTRCLLSHLKESKDLLNVVTLLLGALLLNKD